MSDDRLSGSGRMEGGGYYTAHSEAQEAYGELGFEWLEQAAAEVEPPPAPLPFELLAGSPRTYLGAPGVFALAEGRSFYEPLFPEGLLSLGWSSIAVHWLSGVPTPIPDHIYSTFASGLVREALRERSASDWRAFLTYRARELRTSGRLVVVGGAARDDGMSDAEGLMDMANAALQTMVEDGDLQQAEYARMTIPTWDRTTAEFLEPFDSGENRDAPKREAIGARFDALLRQRIAAGPETAACRWHVVVLDIARL